MILRVDASAPSVAYPDAMPDPSPAIGVMPSFLLSGALHPLRDRPAPLAVLTRIDPLTYRVDGVRSVLIGVSHVGVV